MVFILPEVNMIGSRVTADAPRERKQLEAFGKMSRLSSMLFLSFPVPPPTTNFLTPLSPSPRATPACLKGNGKDCYAAKKTLPLLTLQCYQIQGRVERGKIATDDKEI